MRDINKTGEIKNIKLKDEINKFIGLITNNFTWKNKKIYGHICGNLYLFKFNNQPIVLLIAGLTYLIVKMPYNFTEDLFLELTILNVCIINNLIKVQSVEFYHNKIISNYKENQRILNIIRQTTFFNRNFEILNCRLYELNI